MPDSMPGKPDLGIKVSPDSPNPVRFAAAELRRCLMRMTGERVRLSHAEALPFDESGHIIVGTRDQFSPILGEECPSHDLDDEILVTQRDGNCLITGSNPRSVLFATYDLLEHLGARWIGPGYLGEVLPRRDCSDLYNLEIAQKASYRHRGVSIECAPSLENAISIIDWMAKRKMNTFFLQLKTSLYFWNNYYSREYNKSHGVPEKIDVKRSLEMDDEVIQAVKARGLMLHRVGHGWTAESVGFPGLGWYEAEREPDEATRQLLAEVGGKREFHGNTPLNTELCYSNPRAFRGIVDDVVGYASSHPEVDSLHFWLSDGTNNFCECKSCRTLSPSDWYVRLVRAVAKRMGKQGLKTRLVFLCYSNTLSPPRVERFGPERDLLVFMFAPISRCYVHSLSDPLCSGGGESGGWDLNEVRPPRTNAEYVLIRKGWKEIFDGDSFIFEYYLWMPYHRYLNPLGFARLIHRDIKSLTQLDLNGMVSVQVLRCFYPTGLPMASMAETLWDSEVDLDAVIREHLKACFGRNSSAVYAYLSRMDRLLSPSDDKIHTGPLSSCDGARAAQIVREADAFSSDLDRMEAADDREKRYLALIKHYTKLLRMRAQTVMLRASARCDEANDLARKTSEFLRETESCTEHYLDTWAMLRSLV